MVSVWFPTLPPVLVPAGVYEVEAVFAPPVFSTVAKSVSVVLTPTGTCPLPHSTHVPQNKVPGLAGL